ncbi:MAG: long-chain fatty acid--CoA ligase [Smithellaceae bacterium]|nr:long-chain fatty acid--CoA ligase [Smithellaceae bacterium]
MNLVRLADETITTFGEYPFLVFDDRVYTNREILRKANGLAASLQGLGLQKEEKVVVMLPNCPEVIISYQGILRAGGVIVPLIPLLNGKELAHILANCEAAAMITNGDIFLKNEALLRGHATVRNVIVTDEKTLPGTHSLPAMIEKPPGAFSPPAIDEFDLAVILYTAGTTSSPKGVMLTHRNLYSNAVNAARAHDTRPSDITLVALPLSHSFGLTSMNKAYQYGNLHVLMRKFQPDEAFRLIEKYRVTDFPGAPAMFIALLASPLADRYDLSSLKSCLSGAAPFPVASLLAFQKKFNCTVYEAYGLSEASPAVSTNYHHRPTKPGSIGQPLPEVEVRIVDDDERDVPRGNVGELLVRGPNVSSGYYRQPEETARTFRNGWLHTGDMARMDEDGYLYIVERKKDLIIRGGFNIYPRDLEEILYTHPAVGDAVAIGIPDPVMGEEIKVYVVLKEGATASAEDLHQYCREHLAKNKWPRQIELATSLPRNPMGKILRRELRRLNAGA